MKLVAVKVKGIYGKPGSLLPAGMARLTPDACASLAKVEAEIESCNGCFRLTDAYRSSAMQARAHDDYVRGRKRAYSPPAGSSMHEAGRAIDLDLAALIHPPSVPKGSQTLNEQNVRAIFESHGWTFIAPAGDPHLVDVKESWHIEYRGPFQKVYDSVLKRTGSHSKAYQSMAALAIKDLANDNGPVRFVDAAKQQLDFRPVINATPVVEAALETLNGNDAGRESLSADAGQPQKVDAPAAEPQVASSAINAPALDSCERPRAPEADAIDRLHIGRRLKSSTTFLQSMGIQATAIGAAIWSFVSTNTGRLLYVLGGSAVVSLVAYAIYTWKEVQTKRIEAGHK